MTPSETAEDLILKFKSSQSEDGFNDVRDFHAANRCAIIAVDEILHSIKNINKYDFGTMNYYWQEVKNELEKL
jgi:hypothetical protein